MNKVYFIILTILLNACGDSSQLSNQREDSEKTKTSLQQAEHEKLVAELKSKIETLKENESKLVDKIKKLEEINLQNSTKIKEYEATDQGMWIQAITLVDSNKFEEAMGLLDSIIEKFPETDIRKQIDKKKKEIKANEAKRWKTLEKSFATLDLNNKMASIAAYLSESLLPEQRTLAEKKDVEFKIEWEKNKAEREIESETGAKVQVIETGWKWVQCDDEFMGPYIKLKVQNTSNKAIEINISADFYKGNESIGYADKDIGGLFDPSLKAGKFQTITLFPCWGSRNDLIVLNIPSITAEIKVNKMPLRSVAVKKKAVGYPSF